jgi:hypothetical protein
MSDKPKISIIGGGLSAIYSFWGCIDAGYTPKEIEVIHSGQSKMPGAIFLYQCPIPWKSIPVNSILLGTAEGYAFKQWGDASVKTSAHERFNRSDSLVTEFLYDVTEVLPTLWGMIPNICIEENLSPEDILHLKNHRQAVICTFPDPSVRSEYAKRGFLLQIPVYSKTFQATNYVVIYNGLEEVPWVRQTIMPGRLYVEYPQNAKAENIITYESTRDPVRGSMSLVPDLEPNCPSISFFDRREGNLFRVGRQAAFEPGYLSYEARGEVEAFLNAL